MRWLTMAVCVACGTPAPTADAPAPSREAAGSPAPAPASSTPPAAEAKGTLLDRHAVEGKTPEGALKLWFTALYRAMEADPDALETLGKLTLPYRDDPDWASRPSNRTFVERIQTEPHIFRSYARGATVDNGYAMDPAAFELNIDRVADDGLAVWLISAGADSPRRVVMAQSEQTGLWYVRNAANVYVGVRKPKKPGEETFR